MDMEPFAAAFRELFYRGLMSIDGPGGMSLRMSDPDAIAMALGPATEFPLASAICYLLEKNRRVAGIDDVRRRVIENAKRKLKTKPEGNR